MVRPRNKIQCSLMAMVDITTALYLFDIYFYMFVCEFLVLCVFSSDMFHIQMQSSSEWIDDMK